MLGAFGSKRKRRDTREKIKSNPLSQLPPNTACSATGWISAIFYVMPVYNAVPVGEALLQPAADADRWAAVMNAVPPIAVGVV
jgi:hypothetical protein